MKRHFILIFTIFLLAFTAYGQTNRGTLRGQVKDAADAVIVGATITVVGEDGSERTTQTDEPCAFSFKNLAVVAEVAADVSAVRSATAIIKEIKAVMRKKIVIKCNLPCSFAIF